MKKQISTLRESWQSVRFAIHSYGIQHACKKKYQPFQSDFKNKVYADDEIQVLTGPFAGTKYFDHIVWGPITPKWIGSYENHLHGVIRKVIGVEYTKILDIGAAEGYYAVGLALQSPNSQVTTFDVDPIGRRRQRELASLNSVNNIEIRKLCTHQELSQQIEDRCLVVCDIEGFETELFDPSKCPELRVADVLVELHPFKKRSVDEVAALFESRFAESHHIETIYVEPLDHRVLKNQIPQLANISDTVLLEAINEHRVVAQCWLWMEADQGAAAKALPNVGELGP